MAVAILSCPTCGKKFGVLESNLGKEVVCSHCRANMMTAAPAQNTDLPALAEPAQMADAIERVGASHVLVVSGSEQTPSNRDTLTIACAHCKGAIEIHKALSGDIVCFHCGQTFTVATVPAGQTPISFRIDRLGLLACVVAVLVFLFVKGASWFSAISGLPFVWCAFMILLSIFFMAAWHFRPDKYQENSLQTASGFCGFALAFALLAGVMGYLTSGCGSKSPQPTIGKKN